MASMNEEAPQGAAEAPARKTRSRKTRTVQGVNLPKLIRFGAMNEALRSELTTELDTDALAHVAQSFDLLVSQLARIVGDDLASEVDGVLAPFGERVPSASELRVVHAQLSGWFNGVLQTQITAMRENQREGVEAGLLALHVAQSPDERHPTEGPATLTGYL